MQITISSFIFFFISQDLFQYTFLFLIDRKIKIVSFSPSNKESTVFILNEAITNAIKYAFVGKEKGRIEIRLDYVADQHLRLQIIDVGVGLPDNFDLSSQGSLGLNLMQGLTEQLEGTLNIKNDQGLSISIITYPKEGMDALQRFNFSISGLSSY